MSRRTITTLAAVLVALATLAVTALALTLERGDPPVFASEAAGPGPEAEGPVARAQAAIEANPRDGVALAELANAALLRFRETGDPSWYGTAEEAAQRALEVDPENFRALDAMGELALSRHRFRDAIRWARLSLAAEPGHFAPLGIEGDALIELGRYREGFMTIQRRLNLLPDLPSYSRGSYALELQGDRAGAIQVMELAVGAGAPGSEARTWTLVQLGLLRFGSGDLDGAERDMRAALDDRPGDARATAGLARVLAARGQLDRAAELYEQALDRLPLPEHAAALAEVENARGNDEQARASIELVRAMQGLLEESGVRADLDLALIDADVSRPSADDIARARAAREQRPGVVGDDVLGWVLTRAERCDEGLRLARRSLRLGTRDALMLFHAGMAARCAGQPEEATRRLRAALELNPQFSVRWAPVARRALQELEA